MPSKQKRRESLQACEVLQMLRLEEIWFGLMSKLWAWLGILIGMLPNIVVAVVATVASVTASRFVGHGVHRLMAKLTDNEPISSLLGTVSRLSTIMLGVFFALGLLNLDKTVTSLLAGVGIVGLALGFAFQDIAANFMSGFIMALNRPFVVGDLVEVAGHLGRVKEVAMRASAIETLDGLSVLIPNKDIFQGAIINYTNTPHRRLDVSVGTAYGDDMETVRRVVRDAVKSVPYRDQEHDIELFFEEFGDSSINFVVRIWLNKADDLSYHHARSEAMIAIKKALDVAKLTIPFPIRTLDFGADAVGGKRLDQMRLGIGEVKSLGSR